jgi:hypothetical protein
MLKWLTRERILTFRDITEKSTKFQLSHMFFNYGGTVQNYIKITDVAIRYFGVSNDLLLELQNCCSYYTIAFTIFDTTKLNFHKDLLGHIPDLFNKQMSPINKTKNVFKLVDFALL